MLIKRRHVFAGSLASSLAAPMLGRPAFAETKQINLAGASYDMRDAILGEFVKRTNITPKTFVSPSTQARVDRIRTAPVDCILLDAPFAAYANSESLLQPIEIAKLKNWDKMHPLLKNGQAAPGAPLGVGANPGRMMYTDESKTKITFMPAFFQMDSVGYNAGKIQTENNSLSWGDLFNPKYRGKVAMYGIDWLGMLNAAMGMQALGLFKPVDMSNMTEKEVDTVIAFLKEKKKECHFRAMWKAYGELVNLMASEEVWIADAWWPVIVEVAGKGIPVHYAVAKEGYRAWCNGYGIAATTKNLDVAYEWLNYWMDGYPGAQQSKIGYFSTSGGYDKYLEPELIKQVYGGEGRDGGSLADRAMRVYVWNTRPKNLEYYTEKWNEFLAA
ncbi:MAG TPA: PotD/PotF family extracellular solute-binding protein [Reyranella sp.]|nr:PotD/PotF family extracellular solute-binding protein [Reyranella sp.]